MKSKDSVLQRKLSHEEQVEKQPMGREQIFVIYISDKELVSRINNSSKIKHQENKQSNQSIN